MAHESPEHRLKRLAMRSMRRGIKEMDLILSAFARDRLTGLEPEALDLYDALLEENDHDLYAWINGQVTPPGPYATLIASIAAGADGVAKPGPDRP